MSETFKCFKITPADDTRIDSVYVKADDTWRNAMFRAEASLDAQFSDDVPWSEIKVTIECCELTQDQWDELEHDF